MQQRKLIRLGNSSYAIALPKDWIKKSGLKKGDDVFIMPGSNGELIIQSEFKKKGNGKEAVIRIDDENSEPDIAREIISAYVSGYDSIRVLGNKNKIKIAKGLAKQFINLELIEENEEGAIFKDLLDMEYSEVDRFIRRMDNNIKDMFSVLSNMIEQGKNLKERAKEIDSIDKDITKFYFLIWRFMNIGIENPGVQTSLKMSPKTFVISFWISYNMEQIGDELKKIARKIDGTEKNKKILKEIFDLTLGNYKKSMKAFFEKDKNLAKEIILNKSEIIKACEKLLGVKNLWTISEKFKQINSHLHNNSKMIFYGP